MKLSKWLQDIDEHNHPVKNDFLLLRANFYEATEAEMNILENVFIIQNIDRNQLKLTCKDEDGRVMFLSDDEDINYFFYFNLKTDEIHVFMYTESSSVDTIRIVVNRQISNWISLKTYRYVKRHMKSVGHPQHNKIKSLIKSVYTANDNHINILILDIEEMGDLGTFDVNYCIVVAGNEFVRNRRVYVAGLNYE